LSVVDGLDNAGDSVYERDCTGDVIQHGDFTDLFPRIRNVLQ